MENLKQQLKEAILPNCNLSNPHGMIDKFAEKLSNEDLAILADLVTFKSRPTPSKCLFLVMTGKDKRIRVNSITHNPIKYTVQMWRCAKLRRVQALMHVGDDPSLTHKVCINPYHYESIDPLDSELGPLPCEVDLEPLICMEPQLYTDIEWLNEYEPDRKFDQNTIR